MYEIGGVIELVEILDVLGYYCISTNKFGIGYANIIGGTISYYCGIIPIGKFDIAYIWSAPYSSLSPKYIVRIPCAKEQF